MSKKILHYFKIRPGLSVLTLLLLMIVCTSFKPDLYIIGWDNFSSYFNLKTNIFQTFFATWRAYRGLGVPSDSEAVDLFRQLFSLILSPILPEALLDQVYILSSLSAGILGMYFFSQYLYQTSIATHRNDAHSDLFGFVAGFFYLFNLNTTATFTFPMMMYISRFFSIPLLFYIFYSLISNSKISLQRYIIYVIAIFFISGSYITATIFITMSLAIGIFGFFQHKKARFIVILLFYIALNSFWLLPFANYTKEKSSIIRLAPTFIGANETQINKPKSSYSPRKQLLLYSNFFDTKYASTDNLEQTKYFHEFAKLYQNPAVELGLWIFPLLYLIGSILILFKRRFMLYWMPFILFVFLFLSTKDYSFLGFIYGLLTRVTPFIDVLFRFGDTKLHMYAAFAGSTCASYALLFFISKSKKIGYAILVLFFVITIVVYRDYFIGKFIGKFIYNKVPQAYFEIAKQINEDKEQFRVLHLPYDKDVYWKSYSWGMVGSSFLNFMLDHPLIDKTFEPASMENAYLDKKIISLLENIQSIARLEEKKQRALAFANLLKKVGVKYLIFDASVQTTVPSKGVVYWGNFNNPDVKELIALLKQFGLAETANTYSIDLKEIKKAYGAMYPLNPVQQAILEQNPFSTIELMKMKEYNGPITFLDTAPHIDSNFENVFEKQIPDILPGHFIQDKNESEFVLYPFITTNNSLSKSDGQYNLSIQTKKTKDQLLTINLPDVTVLPEKIVQYLDISTIRDTKNVTISVYEHPLPFAVNSNTEQKIGEIVVPLTKMKQVQNHPSDPLRIKVGDFILEEKKIQTVAVSGLTIPIELLTNDSEVSINTDGIMLTNPENCFDDRLDGHTFSLNKANVLTLTSTNQSTCSWFNIVGDTEHKNGAMEIAMDIEASHVDNDTDSTQNSAKSAKPQLASYINNSSKPNMLYICARPDGYEDCLNMKQIFEIGSGNKKLIIPLDQSISDIPLFNILIALKNTGYQTQTLAINSVRVRYFRSITSDTLNLNYPQETQYTFNNSNNSIELSIPKVMSRDSFSYEPQKGGMYIANSNCSKEGGYRTFRMIQGKLVSSIDNCNTDMYMSTQFDSAKFYLWTLNYNLLSGKYPSLIVDDKISAYFNQMISLNQGYPDMLGFHLFQKPPLPFSSPISNNLFSQLEYRQAFGYLNSHPELQDTKSKKYEIKQDTENEGIMAIKSFSAQPLPSQWENMSISTENNKKSFVIPSAFTYQNILPSLRKVSITAGEQGRGMLLFNEGYDRQWRMYPTLTDAIFGLHELAAPVRCDGYANCFDLTLNNDTSRSYYLLYTPERLSMIGWLITFVGIIGFSWVFVGKNIFGDVERHTN